MKITRTFVLQVLLLGIAAGLLGFEIARTWKSDAKAGSASVVVALICLAAAVLPAFRRKQ